ncbi:M20 family metallopeptidase [Pseudoramibacter porci]|nr:M20 family metallopeptidase [Pseudoramibacter porci]
MQTYPSEEQCKTLLQTLVRTNTCQPEGNEEALVDWIVAQLPQDVTQFKIQNASNRASLIVKLEGDEDDGGVAFVGHLDTVACSEADGWTDPPHGAVVKDHTLYGRGACDMKGGDAAMLLTLKYLLENKVTLKRPVYFCFTSDEEASGLGIQSVLSSGYLNAVDAMIVCEPSREQISNSEKGALWIHVAIDGVSAHASRPTLGINAVEYASLLSQRIKNMVTAKSVHPILGPATAAVTKIFGGSMTNIIPAHAEFEMDIRTNPDTSSKDLEGEIDEIIDQLLKEAGQVSTRSGQLKISKTVINNRPAIETSKDHPLIQTLKAIGAKVGINTGERGHFFYTDASQFIPQMHIPFAIAGPGDDALAHCVNESIDLRSVQRFTKLYINYIMQTNKKD